MIFNEAFELLGKKKKEDPIKLERNAEQKAIKDGNDLLGLMPGLDDTIFRLVQKLGNGDPMKAYEKLRETAGDDANRTVAIFLRDILTRLESRLKIGWKVPEDLTFNEKSMRTYEMLKNGEPCVATNPPIWSLYKSPVTGEQKEVQICHMIVKPIKQTLPASSPASTTASATKPAAGKS